MSSSAPGDGPPRLRFSIAMATYNGARHLREQLDSFAAQTRPPDEVVVCDDRSGDDTLAVLELYRAGAPFAMRILPNPERLGIVRNFERAIRECAGDVIFLSDQDDVWHAEKLARHEAIYRSRPEVGLVFNDLDVVDEALQPLGHTTFDFQRVLPRRQARMGRGHAFELLVKRPMINGCAMSFRAEYREVFLPMPGRLYVHDEWIALLVSAMAVCAPIGESLGLYRQHTQQSIGATHGEGPIVYDRDDYIDTQLSRLALAIDRLAPLGSRLLHRNYLAFIEGKRTHLLRRRGLGGSPLRRLPTVAREVLNGNYKRYGGWAKVELKSDLRGA